MIAFAREALYEMSAEVGRLLQAHYEELAKNQDRVKLNVDWERYAQLAQSGSYLVFTVRNDGVLVGYSGFFTSPHPHYRGAIPGRGMEWRAQREVAGRSLELFARR